jgi:hypothetical protein
MMAAEVRQAFQQPDQAAAWAVLHYLADQRALFPRGQAGASVPTKPRADKDKDRIRSRHPEAQRRRGKSTNPKGQNLEFKRRTARISAIELRSRCPRYRWSRLVRFLPELQRLGRGHLTDGAIQQTALVLNARGIPIAHHGVRYCNQADKCEKADEREPVDRKRGGFRRGWPMGFHQLQQSGLGCGEMITEGPHLASHSTNSNPKAKARHPSDGANPPLAG